METPVMRDLENTASKINPDWIITLLFVLFLGIFGVHRFYNGKIGT
jgi:TM2 domain-containing membrane protein YozV